MTSSIQSYALQVLDKRTLYLTKNEGEMRILTKLDEEQLGVLKSSIENLEYGSIVITIHDGTITQIDTTEKKRFNKYLLSKKTQS